MGTNMGTLFEVVPSERCRRITAQPGWRRRRCYAITGPAWWPSIADQPNAPQKRTPAPPTDTLPDTMAADTMMLAHEPSPHQRKTQRGAGSVLEVLAVGTRQRLVQPIASPRTIVIILSAVCPRLKPSSGHGLQDCGRGLSKPERKTPAPSKR